MGQVLTKCPLDKGGIGMKQSLKNETDMLDCSAWATQHIAIGALRHSSLLA